MNTVYNTQGACACTCELYGWCEPCARSKPEPAAARPPSDLRHIGATITQVCLPVQIDHSEGAQVSERGRLKVTS